MSDVTVEVGFENYRGDFEHLATIPMYFARAGAPAASIDRYYVGMFPDIKATLDSLVQRNPQFTQAWVRIKGIAVLILDYKKGNWILF